MATKEQLESLNVDVNSNTEKTEEFVLYDLLEIGLKAGRLLFFGVSHTVRPSSLCTSDFILKTNWKQKILLRFIHFWFFMFLMVPFITENIYLSPCCLVNWIKKGLHVVLSCSLIVGYYCLEVKAKCKQDGIGPIFRQCAILQQKFRRMGLHFPARYKLKAFGWGMITFAIVTCVIRQYIFGMKVLPWHARYARYFTRTISFGFWTTGQNSTSENMSILFGTFGILADGLVCNFWFYCQAFRFFCSVTIWLVFEKLVRSAKSGFFGTKHLPDLMDLHFESVKLLNCINRLVSPLTFWSVVFNVVCSCFWTNYMAMDFKIRPFYIAALCFFLKTIVEMFLEADINSKAHEMTEWLEEECTKNEPFPSVDPVKLAIFTSQMYNKEFTGLKGLNIFIITPRLALTIFGIVATYSVAVNQLCHW